jgi:uncharacterized protein YqeY
MLLEKIKKDITDALKAGDKDKVSCLRVLLASIKNREKNLRKELDDQEVLAILRTEIKQVTDSHDQFLSGRRDDLAAREQANLNILKAYLPAEMSEEEITALVDAAIAETGATKKDLGKLIKLVMTKVAGRADGKRINAIVSTRLAG